MLMTEISSLNSHFRALNDHETDDEIGRSCLPKAVPTRKINSFRNVRDFFKRI